jgi:hypothetical protein
MGMFKDVTAGFANRFVSAAVATLRGGRSLGHAANGLVLTERICQELGWSVDERDSDAILLHFTDPVIGIRKIAISNGEKVMAFAVCSSAIMNPRQVSAEIMAYLLLRNSRMGGSAWQMFEVSSGNVGFSVAAYMLIDGMNAAMFEFLCETMAKEAHEFDAKVKAAGVCDAVIGSAV